MTIEKMILDIKSVDEMVVDEMIVDVMNTTSIFCPNIFAY